MTFDELIFKELDQVWNTYLIRKHEKYETGRRIRQAKHIKIYWWEKFLNYMSKTDKSNPLMDLILDELKLYWKAYLPLYKRVRHRWYKTAWLDFHTRFNIVENVWDYADNIIDHTLDELIWGYPPILSWMLVEKPTSKNWENLLQFYIKKRYASKKNGDSETSNSWTNAQSSWTAES